MLTRKRASMEGAVLSNPEDLMDQRTLKDLMHYGTPGHPGWNATYDRTNPILPRPPAGADLQLAGLQSAGVTPEVDGPLARLPGTNDMSLMARMGRGWQGMSSGKRLGIAAALGLGLGGAGYLGGRALANRKRRREQEAAMQAGI